MDLSNTNSTCELESYFFVFTCNLYEYCYDRTDTETVYYFCGIFVLARIYSGHVDTANSTSHKQQYGFHLRNLFLIMP